MQEGWKEYPERERRDPHPADSYNFNHQLATPPASDRGRVICEKHVDLREQEGRPDSFISSYISWKRSARTFVNVAEVSAAEKQVEAQFGHSFENVFSIARFETLRFDSCVEQLFSKIRKTIER